MIQKAKFTYSTLKTTFEKQIKIIEDKSFKTDTEQLSIKNEIPEGKLSEQANNEKIIIKKGKNSKTKRFSL